MTKREAMRQTAQTDRLVSLGFTRDEAASMYRLSMTLHRWHDANLSDFLSDAAETVRQYRLRQRYQSIGNEIDLLVEIMDAVRGLPGLDAPPDAANRFSADIDAALRRFQESKDGVRS